MRGDVAQAGSGIAGIAGAEAPSAEAAAEAGAAAKDASGEPIELKKILEDAWRK